jgi:hypothetical protein
MHSVIVDIMLAGLAWSTGVSIIPRKMAFTLMLSCASSLAALRLRPRTAHFVMPYAAAPA